MSKRIDAKVNLLIRSDIFSILNDTDLNKIKLTNTIYINARELYWGLGLTDRSTEINYLGGELLYKTKNKQIYGFGLGVNQDFQPVLSGRMYWKIGK